MLARSLSRPAFAWVALAAAGLIITGCAQPSATGSRERVFAADLAGGARKCEAPTPSLTDGQTAQVAMKVVNDGGWCGVVVSRSGRAFDTGLLTTRPTHGKVVVIRVGDATRITYTPPPRFAGTDSFAVKLIPGDATVQVTATVTAN